MKNILHKYVSEFNENDNEYYNQDIKKDGMSRKCLQLKLEK